MLIKKVEDQTVTRPKVQGLFRLKTLIFIWFLFSSPLSMYKYCSLRIFSFIFFFTKKLPTTTTAAIRREHRRKFDPMAQLIFKFIINLYYYCMSCHFFIIKLLCYPPYLLLSFSFVKKKK